MAKSAIFLVTRRPSVLETRLGSIFEFFGVPWETIDIAAMGSLSRNDKPAILTSADTLAAVLQQRSTVAELLQQASALYIYAAKDPRVSADVLRCLLGDAHLSTATLGDGPVKLRISREADETAGPMAGLEIPLQAQAETCVVGGRGERGQHAFTTIMSADGQPIFIRFYRNGIPVFFCGSSEIVDIQESVGPGFYDVKPHLCSACPLIMFLRFTFREGAWLPQELGACLIIDDPLLRRRYGHCDFVRLGALMRQHAFTTNIAFIPWNWRRTTPDEADFFRSDPNFSVSIHGCDHAKEEFGTTSLAGLNALAGLAQTRMRNHEKRTQISHDGIMVFPQGVFSSFSPQALKLNGFMAAVNTETAPVDAEQMNTCVKDVWAMAITSYGGGFPIFTRRYASHGIENFAFDLLLGKPCLIVAHHEFFRDGGLQAVELVDKLNSLNCSLRWQSLGNVIRSACRRRAAALDQEDIELYSRDSIVVNDSSHEISATLWIREQEPGAVEALWLNDTECSWDVERSYLKAGVTLRPFSRTSCRVSYKPLPKPEQRHSALRPQTSVALRRVLCEFRDDYLSTSRILSAAAATLKNVVARAR